MRHHILNQILKSLRMDDAPSHIKPPPPSQVGAFHTQGFIRIMEGVIFMKVLASWAVCLVLCHLLTK